MKYLAYLFHKFVTFLGRLIHQERRQPPTRPLMEVALDYCAKHPEAKASIIAAGIRHEADDDNGGKAWDGAQFVECARPHRFSSAAPWGRCARCGDTREAAKSIECQKFQPPHDIAQVIRNEEEKYQKVIIRAEKKVEKDREYTGGELFQMWETFGISPDVVEMIQNRVLPREVWESYNAAADACSNESRVKRKPREVLKAKTAEDLP